MKYIQIEMSLSHKRIKSVTKLKLNSLYSQMSYLSTESKLPFIKKRNFTYEIWKREQKIIIILSFVIGIMNYNNMRHSTICSKPWQHNIILFNNEALLKVESVGNLGPLLPFIISPAASFFTFHCMTRKKKIGELEKNKTKIGELEVVRNTWFHKRLSKNEHFNNMCQILLLLLRFMWFPVEIPKYEKTWNSIRFINFNFYFK